MLGETKLADSYKNISCLIGHIFQEVHPPCKACNDDMDRLILIGLGHDGKEAKLVIKDLGIFEVYGSESLLEEIDNIRNCRCFNGRK